MPTREELRAYWQALDPKTRVGWARSIRACPLALYLRQRPNPPHSLRLLLEQGYVPEWVYRFLRQIDLTRGPITAGRALAVLNLVEVLER